jgi:hypothetical protein
VSGPKETALETRGAAGGRMFSPSAARNRDPIRTVFLAHMPLAGALLEIGSGTGEHAVHLAAAAPQARFLPGDPDPASRASIAAWTAHAGLANVAPPHALDVATPGWEQEVREPIAGVVSINMIHIAPFAAAQGLFAGAGRLLRPKGRAFLYGPFARDGRHVAPSNADFDRSLKARDPSWGVRDLEREIVPLAEECGFGLAAVVAMPANNFSAVFERR